MIIKAKNKEEVYKYLYDNHQKEIWAINEWDSIKYFVDKNNKNIAATINFSGFFIIPICSDNKICEEKRKISELLDLNDVSGIILEYTKEPIPGKFTYFLEEDKYTAVEYFKLNEYNFSDLSELRPENYKCLKNYKLTKYEELEYNQFRNLILF